VPAHHTRFQQHLPEAHGIDAAHGSGILLLKLPKNLDSCKIEALFTKMSHTKITMKENWEKIAFLFTN
jgi:hypothetical protein